MPHPRLKPPYMPMEAEAVAEIPVGPQWAYEPKWDGFRCLAFRRGDEVVLQSKSGQPLSRYFPEIVAVLRDLPASDFVLDGELAVPVRGRFSFDDLLQRIHPAASRIAKLAEAVPAVYIVFDCLADAGARLTDRPLGERRKALETFARRNFKNRGELKLSPLTHDLKRAQAWFRKVGGDLDGIVAKRLDLPYRSGERDGMRKIKKIRTADCVVGGFRYAEGKREVGSLLLGLYDERGLLHHVGFSSSFKAAERRALTKKLEPLIAESSFTGQTPGKPSRWSTKRSAEWKPLQLRHVVEVTYDHFTNGRFRHGTRILRWRPDKRPRQCTLDQLPAGGGRAAKLLEAAPPQPKRARRVRKTAR